MKAATLSGGSTKGIAHIGALKAMNDNGYFPEIIAGTSIGSIVAFAYACGRLKELEAIFDSLKATNIMSKPPMNNTGKLGLSAYWNLFTKGYMADLDNLRYNLMELISPEDHASMKVICYAMSVDLANGKRVVKRLDEISYKDAIDACIESSSIPIINKLPKWMGQIFADGGVRTHNPGYWLLQSKLHPITELVSVYTRPRQPRLPHFKGGNAFQTLSRTIDIMNLEISKNDEMSERYYAKKQKVKLYQVFSPSILKGLYDTNNERLIKLKLETEKTTKEKLRKYEN